MLAFLSVYDKISVMEMTKSEKKRIFLLDEIRGLAIFCMIFYHAYYIFAQELSLSGAQKLFGFFTPFEPFFAALFISICGVSCSLSHNNLRRGLIITAAALALSLVTCVIMPAMGFYGAQIRFGILHLLGVCVLIYAIGAKLFNRANPFVGIIFCAVLYPFFSGIDKGNLSYGELINITLPDFLYSNDYLMPLGIYSPEFYSADYFPIFPFIFIFFVGVFAGRIFIEKGFPETSYKKRSRFLSFLGTHTFIIYLLHMPVTYGLAFAIKNILNL